MSHVYSHAAAGEPAAHLNERYPDRCRRRFARVRLTDAYFLETARQSVPEQQPEADREAGQ
jgi:hypothetical protein